MYGFHGDLLTVCINPAVWSCLTCTRLRTWPQELGPLHHSLALGRSSGFLRCLWRGLEVEGQTGGWTFQILLTFKISEAARDSGKTKTPGCQRPLLLKGWMKDFFLSLISARVYISPLPRAKRVPLDFPAYNCLPICTKGWLGSRQENHSLKPTEGEKSLRQQPVSKNRQSWQAGWRPPLAQMTLLGELEKGPLHQTESSGCPVW